MYLYKRQKEREIPCCVGNISNRFLTAALPPLSFSSLSSVSLPHPAHVLLQGLGLLINLVEYSARNRHCLVDMESYTTTSLKQSQGEGVEKEKTQGPELAPAPASTQAGEEPAAVSPTDGKADGTEEKTKGPFSGALAALVQVGMPLSTPFQTS